MIEPTPRRERSRNAVRALWPLLLANFALTLVIAYQYVLRAPEVSGGAQYLYLRLAWVSNFALLYVVVGVALTVLCAAFPAKRSFVLLTGPLLLLLNAATFADAVVYRIFRFHINGMVINLFQTEGAWDSVHLGPVTLGSFLLLIAGAAFLEFWAAARLHRWANSGGRIPRRWAVVAVLATVAVIASEKVLYAAADLRDDLNVTRFSKVFPLFQPLTVKRIAVKRFGYKLPQREGPSLGDKATGLRYPREKLSRTASGQRPNIVWILVDAWRSDMLNPETSPNLWRFAQRSLVFQDHYSGGNATRFGVFSLFYGVYGYYWHQFLGERQSPVLIDELLGLGYDFKILSSTRLSFPEFRKTAFVRIPEAIEDELGGEGAAYRDPKLAARFIDWVGNRKPDRPFFAFLFFDAPHGPYDYPPEFERFQPSKKTPNYVTIGRRDMVPLKNSYRNAIAFDDELVGKVVDALEKKGLLRNTIVVISADHGEEFYESGYYGHTSAFSRQQTQVPLILYLPGTPHREITYRTSHLDLVPTTLGLLGYTTPPAAYCQGKSLLDGAGDPFVVSSGWNDGAIIDGEGTIVFSTETYNSSRFEVRDRSYRRVEDWRAALKGRSGELAAVAKGFRDFVK